MKYMIMQLLMLTLLTACNIYAMTPSISMEAFRSKSSQSDLHKEDSNRNSMMSALYAHPAAFGFDMKVLTQVCQAFISQHPELSNAFVRTADPRLNSQANKHASPNIEPQGIVIQHSSGEEINDNDDDNDNGSPLRSQSPVRKSGMDLSPTDADLQRLQLAEAKSLYPDARLTLPDNDGLLSDKNYPCLLRQPHHNEQSNINSLNETIIALILLNDMDPHAALLGGLRIPDLDSFSEYEQTCLPPERVADLEARAQAIVSLPDARNIIFNLFQSHRLS